jgi:hypothetical protein
MEVAQSVPRVRRRQISIVADTAVTDQKNRLLVLMFTILLTIAATSCCVLIAINMAVHWGYSLTISKKDENSFAMH